MGVRAAFFSLPPLGGGLGRGVKRADLKVGPYVIAVRV